MKRYAVAFAVLAALFSAIGLRLDRPHAGMIVGGSGGAPPGCSQATTFIARTSGENSSALTTFICGLVTDGFIDSDASMASTGGNPFCGATGKLDRLWILAMANSTDAVLDVCGHATGITANGSPTFTANAGYTGVDQSSTVYLDSGYNPATGASVYTLNSAFIMGWSLTNNQSAGANPVMIGENDATNGLNLQANNVANNSFATVNTASSSFTLVGGLGANGSFIATRTASNAQKMYYNGSAQTGSNDSATSTAIPTGGNIFILAINLSGSPSLGFGNQVAMAAAGAGLDPTHAGNLHSRGCTYLTSVHGSC